MDINLLAINIGNTRLAIGIFVSGDLKFATRVANENRSDWAGKIKDAWQRIGAGEEGAVAAASVNPPLNEFLEHAVKEATGQRIEWVGRDIELPIKVLT